MIRPTGCTCPTSAQLIESCPVHGSAAMLLAEHARWAEADATVDRYEKSQRDRVRTAVAAVRARHTSCSTERGACPWPNFTEHEADELAAELLQPERGQAS
ncbi:MAG: hypothetical protein J0I34_07395 [Pseudonocardia sp.]|uniref:hypothetical protein n=1 Tax=Actinomycetes TaxID=1760 RepID=UPI00086B90F5|nr:MULTISPECIES: hypothetical protein [Actinomycetes]MBN9108592.1 hypothetical protein [Pseudonocardia sp.]ODU27471.1 MAG: hypothetical protein ABS80_03580 [Pseudonocardia sp. SCN 72-51]ODV07767.1 MAG: hypothetical protein ABT15_06740 [Pseudonocardia sp. SCN 73-27]